MRTNIDINDKVLNEIIGLKPSVSKKEIVNTALQEYLMHIKRKELLTFIDKGIDWDGDLEQWRSK
jgi:Arc/MetJ family transcription regulator